MYLILRAQNNRSTADTCPDPAATLLTEANGGASDSAHMSVPGLLFDSPELNQHHRADVD